jgi:ubiquinone/menaquinone biosynthesis C-methylase UbiE
MKRVFDEAESEMMDRPQPVGPELEADLENLRQLNRYFGGYRLVRRFLRCWLKPGRTYRLLDLATGFGDIPRMIVDWARRRNIAVRIHAVDSHPSTLALARRHSEGYPEIEFIRADARTFGDQLTYDLVLCSLTLHHFSDDDAVRVLRRAAQLSHDKVLVADLERSWLTWASVEAITTLWYRAPMTRHDARLSVKRSFSFQELDEIAQRAGWTGYGHRRFLPARQALWLGGRHEAPVIAVTDPAFECA